MISKILCRFNVHKWKNKNFEPHNYCKNCHQQFIMDSVGNISRRRYWRYNVYNEKEG
jgi:hypothetical protein